MATTAHGAHDDHAAHEHPHPDRVAPLRLFDQPQGHRHDVPRVRHGRRRDRRLHVDRHPHGAAVPRPAGVPRQPSVQRVHHRARPDHDLLHGHAGADRRLRQLDRAADDRGAGHGVPAHEQHLVLAAAGLVRAAADVGLRRRRAGRARRRRRLDDLCAAVDHRPSGPGGRLRHPVAASRGRVVDPRRDQLHHHDLQHARARHDDAQDAAVRVGRARHRVPAAAVAAGSGRRDHHAADRPQLRHHLLHRRRAAATRSCSSTCSGSSATPRSTS